MVVEALEPRLSSRERQIMDALFQLGEGTVAEVQERLARLAAPDVLGDHARGTFGTCRGRDVRCHRHARMGPERVVCRQRFGPENVERCVTDPTGIERFK